MGRFGSNFGDWRDDLTWRDRATWPRKMREAVAAGGDPESLMHECFANPQKWADPIVQKRAPAPTQLRGASILHVQKADDELREISGIATRAELDRAGDIVVSAGVRFRNPSPLLLGHDHSKPVGQVWFYPGKDEIRFRARLPKIEEPGPLRDRVEEAYQAVKAGLLAAVSIGFRVLDDGAEPLPGGGWKFTATEIMELSLVAVPALPSAVITGVRAIDEQLNKHARREPATTELPAGLTSQQQEDLLFAQARRFLGKSAGQPASQLTLYVTAAQLRHQQRTIAQAFLELDARISALEGK